MMRALDEMQVRDALIERIRAGVPFLGICLGLQALFERSEEAPEARGLASVSQARCGDFRPMRACRTWDGISSMHAARSRLLAGLDPRAFVYFAHSYYAPAVSQTAATCTYSLPYTAVLESGNTFGGAVPSGEVRPVWTARGSQFRGAEVG